MNETKKASGAIYIVPIVYVLGMYLMPVVLWVMGSTKESADNVSGTGSADYTGTGEFSRGSYSGRKNKQRSASYLHKNYQICLNSLLLFRWSLYCSGALTYVYAGCYHGVCRTDHRSLTFGNRLARTAGSGALFRCLYCAGMQRRGTWKSSVGFCRHIPVLFQCGCYFCNYISHKGQSL